MIYTVGLKSCYQINRYIINVFVFFSVSSIFGHIFCEVLQTASLLEVFVLMGFDGLLDFDPWTSNAIFHESIINLISAWFIFI